MAQKQKIDFLGGTVKGKNLSVSNQLTDNLITSLKGAKAKDGIVLESAPGLILRGDIDDSGAGSNRAAKWLSWNGLSYAVFGANLYSINSDYSYVKIGTLNTSSGQVVMSRGRNSIMLVDGTNGYTYDGTTFAEITDEGFPGVLSGSAPTHSVYIDGFFIVNDPSNDNFFKSAQEDPTSWNGLDFEAASVAPDNVLAIAATESILYMVGEETTQPYYNSGDPDFPYDVYLQGVQEVGIKAIYSIAESDEGVFWLATTPQGGLYVYRMQGTQGQIISGEEQSWEISQLLEPENGIGFIYTQNDKSFYVLQFLADNLTMVFNIKAGVWETRSDSPTELWRIGGHGIIAGKNIGGHISDKRFYELSLTTYTNDDKELIRKRRTQIIHSDNNKIDWLLVVLDFESGVGNASGQGIDPTVSLRYKDDNNNWSNVLTKKLGKIGQNNWRTRFPRLGSGRNREYEWWVSDPVDVTFKSAYGMARVLND